MPKPSKQSDIVFEPNIKRVTPKGNETAEHYFLKQAAAQILKLKYNCQFVGKEVWLGKDRDNNIADKYPGIPINVRKKTDAAGIQYYAKKEPVIRNIEVKVSRSDFLNGYSTMGDYNYILAPRGVLNVDDIPAPIGLFVADIDKISISVREKEFYGAELIKYPSRLKRKYYIIGKHKDYVNWVKDNMLRAYTNELVYRNMWIYN